MDSSEYLKYVTEKVVKYMDPSEEEETKPSRKASREPWLTRWFGLAPLGLMMWWGARTHGKNETHPEARSMDSTSYR
ncbi:YqzE family protein [Cohnella cholangitidis]|uniref:YqzE family protein n=1 Tax=Cohnella cholangitidis TaxID=2598458 RepID=A0A7G5C430_9BACL|nr:YqzE family protein [Cohnella cholangitidis]QMV43964.1 YqzE family protein [Cohnella cholangitidis]